MYKTTFDFRNYPIRAYTISNINMVLAANKHSVFNIIPYHEASPEIQAIYDDTKKSLGIPFVLNWFKCQARNPVLLKGNWAKLKATLIEGTVPNVIKQLIIYNVSSERNCEYCANAHRIFANLMGKSLSDDANFTITDNMDSDIIPQSYKIAVSVVTEAALSSGEISEQHVERLMDAGFSESEIQELFAQADLVNMLNTIANISGIKLDTELTELGV